jgi:hypothetical protein
MLKTAALEPVHDNSCLSSKNCVKAGVVCAESRIKMLTVDGVKGKNSGRTTPNLLHSFFISDKT